MKIKKSRYKFLTFCFFAVVFLVAVLTLSGCQLGGLVSVFGTEGHHEKEIPAEYDLTKYTDHKILILVDQPAYLNTTVNLRYYLTKAMRQDLVAKLEIPEENFVSYDKLSEYRSNEPNFSLLSPVDVGKVFDANMVLLVMVEDYQLDEMAQTSYYKGLLNTRLILFKTSTGEKLWPQAEASKGVKVGFEFETTGLEVAISRLVAASAYCTTRYFYNCPKAKFRIAEDRTSIGWESWEQ